ncbi:putative serine-rich protein C2F12.03c [Bienertia sinuspersici]
MKGHTREECFKLIGYPDSYKGKKGKNKAAYNVTKQNQESNQETPLEKGSEVGEPGGSKNDALVSAVVQEVLKALGEKQNSDHFTDERIAEGKLEDGVYKLEGRKDEESEDCHHHTEEPQEGTINGSREDQTNDQVQQVDHEPEVEQIQMEEVMETRRSQREKKIPEKYKDFENDRGGFLLLTILPNNYYLVFCNEIRSNRFKVFFLTDVLFARSLSPLNFNLT